MVLIRTKKRSNRTKQRFTFSPKPESQKSSNPCCFFSFKKKF